jgi:peptidoglycan/LPS O-acetylase OafA/YrhL
MRGLTAFYVLIHHTRHKVTLDDLARLGAGAGWNEILAFRLSRFLAYGHDAVGVFIVLSGFCLMLPVVRSAERTLRGGIVGFLRGRVRRIIPPYYAAIGVSVVLLCVTVVLQTHRWPGWPVSVRDLVSHVLLVHNLDRATIISINGAMWSIATEFQIYLLFPALLLIWRRFGLTASVLTGFALGYAVMIASVLTGQKVLFWLSPWYLGLFALGMASAVICQSQEPRFIRLREQVRWDRVSYGFWVAFAMSHLFGIRLDPKLDPCYWIDLLLGLATASLIVHYATLPASARRPWFLRLLESRLLTGLGLFSYSLYLIHTPLIGFFDLLVPGASAVSPLGQLVASLALSLLCIPSAYVFFLAFEKPFLKALPGPRTAPATTQAQPVGRALRFEQSRS